MGLGIAVGALILRFAMLLHENVGVETAADFQFAFLLVALLAAVATGASWTLRRDAGASVIHG